MSTYDNEGYSEAYYFEDGMVYFDFDDEKVKESATLEDFGLDLVMYDLQGIKSSNIKSISKSSVSNNGKNFTKLDMKVKVSGVNFVQDILDELIWLGYSDASCETVDVTVFINSDGYIEKYCIDTLVSCDDMSIDLNSVLTMDSPGKTFTVEKPDDLDQYQEIDY